MPADLDAALRDLFTVFRCDLVKYEADVARALAGMSVAQHEFDAAVSFHFNTGAIGTASWVKAWRAGRKSQAAAEMMNWKKPAEIIPHREAEKALFQSGTYGTKAAAVWPVNAAGRITWKAVRTLSQSQILNLMKSGATVATAPVGFVASLLSAIRKLFGGSNA